MNSDPAVQSVEDKWQDSDKHYRCMCECAIHTTKKRHDWFGGRKYRLAHLFEKCRDVYKLNPTSIFKHEQCKAAHASSINLRVIYTILIILLLFDGDRLYATSVCGGNATNSGLCVAATASKTIVFCEPPSITTQPTDQIDCKGRIVSFSVVATGSGLTYTWQRKKPSEGSFTNIPAESNVSYPTPGTIRLQNVGNSFAPDGTKYQVVVSNANCSVTSNPATLTVNEITDIKPVSTDVTKCYGNNYSYTVTTSYPSNVISYQWKKSVSPGVWVIVTDGGSILGATTNQLNIAGGTPSESGEYRVYITFHASGADCNVSSDTRTRKLTFLPQLQAPVVTGNQTICYNTAPAQLTATPASGGSGTTYSYQWQSSPDNLNWNNIGTNSLNYQPPVLTSSTYYRIIATDTGTYGCSTATSISILITVNPLPTPIISGFSNVCPGASGIVYSTPFVTGHTYRWSATGASFYSGENTNTLTVTWTNVCSNSTGIVKVTETITATGCSAITPDYPVTITDNTAPTWTTVAGALNTSVECGDAAGLTASQALAPVATDNCSSVTYTKTSGSFVAGSCGVTGTYTNTWVAKDACLNTSTVFTQVIIITDNTSPIWTTVAGALNTSLECSDAAGLTASQALSPIATDNCGSVTYTKTSGSFVAGSCSATGTYTNTWVAKDACLNTSTVFTQVITITDNTVPTWTTVAGALNTSVECSNAAGLTAALALAPVATDNCSSVTYTKTSGSFVSGSSGATGTYTNTWVAKDACLNTSAVFTQIITITDNIAPTWTTIAGALNTSLECGDAAGLAAAQALASVATDNCSNVTYIKTSGSFVEGSCRATGTYTNTWVAKDACLNTSAVYTQVITIKDNTAPTWTTIAGALNTSLECGDAAGLAAAQALVPIAIDNCDADVTDIVKISGVFVPGGSPNEGTYTNTWTVTDACGNVSTVFTQVITISDNTAPIITCPANVTIDCEDNNTPAGTGTATVTDNYAPSGNITIIFSDVSTYKADPANVLHYNYTITRKWRATDVTGNFSECTQTITVHDVTASAITCPANVTIDCEDDTTPAGTGTAKAIDNYAPAGNITITFSDVSTYKADPSSILHYNYTITRKWRATDVVGNFS
ncbi:MAG: hypothetical protein NTX93_12290, partial [Bacteroidia bacterium]|nr:hypothetical protein [Bacteroidia bacterium]